MRNMQHAASRSNGVGAGTCAHRHRHRSPAYWQGQASCKGPVQTGLLGQHAAEPQRSSACRAPSCKAAPVCMHPSSGAPPSPHHNLDDHGGLGVVAHAGAVQRRAVAVGELLGVAPDLVAAPGGQGRAAAAAESGVSSACAAWRSNHQVCSIIAAWQAAAMHSQPGAVPHPQEPMNCSLVSEMAPASQPAGQRRRQRGVGGSAGRRVHRARWLCSRVHARTAAAAQRSAGLHAPGYLSGQMYCSAGGAAASAGRQRQQMPTASRHRRGAARGGVRAPASNSQLGALQSPCACRSRRGWSTCRPARSSAWRGPASTRGQMPRRLPRTAAGPPPLPQPTGAWPAKSCCGSHGQCWLGGVLRDGWEQGGCLRSAGGAGASSGAKQQRPATVASHSPGVAAVCSQCAIRGSNMPVTLRHDLAGGAAATAAAAAAGHNRAAARAVEPAARPPRAGGARRTCQPRERFPTPPAAGWFVVRRPQRGSQVLQWM